MPTSVDTWQIRSYVHVEQTKYLSHIAKHI